MIIEGIPYYPFVFHYRDHDNVRRQRTLWAPAAVYAGEAFDRECGENVKPRTNVRVRSAS